MHDDACRRELCPLWHPWGPLLRYVRRLRFASTRPLKRRSTSHEYRMQIPCFAPKVADIGQMNRFGWCESSIAFVPDESKVMGGGAGSACDKRETG